jgi:hypothetical protein
LRRIEIAIVEENPAELLVEVASGVDLYILNNKRVLLTSLEKKYDVFIEIVGNVSLEMAASNIIVKKYKATEKEEDPFKEKIEARPRHQEKKYKDKIKQMVDKQDEKKEIKQTLPKDDQQPPADTLEKPAQKAVRPRRRASNHSGPPAVKHTETVAAVVDEDPVEKKREPSLKRNSWLKKIFG